MAAALDSLADRAQDDPFFIACPLHWYAVSESLTETTLTEILGCTPETLVKLRLCRTPQTQPPAFGREVAAIAARFGLNEAALAKAVRRGMVVLNMQSASRPSLAARDRKPEEPQ